MNEDWSETCPGGSSSAVRSRLSEEDRRWRQLRQEMAEALRVFDAVKPSLRNQPNRYAQAASVVFDVARRMEMT